MRLDFRLPLSEMLFLRKFFDGVDYAVARELAADEVAYEEFLSPLLGRLLDSRSGFQALLSYPLKALNADLQECGMKSKLDIEFETIEHAKGFSGSTSHADLGIVFRYQNPAFGEEFEKAILIEAKRLYPVGRKYKLRSRYEGFDPAQFSALWKFDSKHDYGVVFYLLYNPVLDAFEEEDAALIRALEIRSIEHGMRPGVLVEHLVRAEYFGHPHWRFMAPPAGASPLGPDANALRELLAERVTRKPGLRVMGLSSIERIIGESVRAGSSKPSLIECYRYDQNSDWWGEEGAVPFVSLSAFLVDFFMSCFRGSTTSEVVEVASGRDPDQPGESKGVTNVLARHTLRITLATHLPSQEGLFIRG